MKAKARYGAKSEIPAGMEAFYVERDGAWCLEVEGVVEKGKLEEFRSRNVALMKERDELLARFEGIDPEEVRKLAEEKRKLEEERQVKAGEFEKVMAARLAAAKGEHEKALGTVTAERDKLQGRLSVLLIDQAVVAEAMKRSLKASAVPDITARARASFRLRDGVPQVMEGESQSPRMGKDGVTPMSVAEWLEQQAAEAPHLFEGNTGGGAAGNGSGGAGAGKGSKNPWKKESWNITEQFRLTKSNPDLAARLEAAA